MNVLSKEELRKDMGKRRKLVSSSDAYEAGNNIADALLDILAERTGRSIVLSFASYNHEPDTDIIFKRIKAAFPDISVAYPIVSDDKIHMEYYIINDTDELLPGYMGIREPKALPDQYADADNIGEEFDDIYVIVPGLAFDCRGYRAGYGGGFYDRYLKRINGTFIGICYDFQYLSNSVIETEIYDISCDYIVTDKRVNGRV